MILMVLLFSVCGCGEKDEESSISAPEKLVIWSYFETEVQIEGLNRLTKAFNESQSGYEVSWEYVPLTEFDRRISRAYTEEELPDIVIMDNPDMSKFIRLGMFEDITEYVRDFGIDDEYYGAAVGTCKYNNEYFGVPFNVNNVCIIYRRDIFEKENLIPATDYEGFMELAAKLTDKDRYGFLMSAIDSEQGSFQMMNWVMSSSGQSRHVEKDSLVRVFDYLNEMISNGYMPTECINYSQTDVARRFIKGDIAMMENGPWVYEMLDEAGIDYGLAPMPADKNKISILGGENLGIIKDKNVKGSAEFIRFCVEEGGTLEFCRYSRLLPANISQAAVVVRESPKLKIINDQMNNAIPRSDISDYTSISKKMMKNFARFVAGEMTSDEAAIETIK